MQTPLFAKLPNKVCRHLVKKMHPRTYEENEVVFQDDELGAGAILIKTGRISLKAGDQELAQLSAGDFFGEGCLVVNEPRTATAVALEKSELIFFLQSDLAEWVEASPKHGAQLALNLSRVLVSRLREANDQLENRITS